MFCERMLRQSRTLEEVTYKSQIFQRQDSIQKTWQIHRRNAHMSGEHRSTPSLLGQTVREQLHISYLHVMRQLTRAGKLKILITLFTTRIAYQGGVIANRISTFLPSRYYCVATTEITDGSNFTSCEARLKAFHKL